MVRDFEGQVPQIDAKAHVFETAAVIGKVTMKEYSSYCSMLLCAAM